MSDTTGISWCDSTFNPWMGCTKVSPACDHCYAERDTRRFGRVEWGAGKTRVRTSAQNWKLPLRWNNSEFYECPACGWRGEGFICGNAIGNGGSIKGCKGEPVRARRRVFCASLADVFDNEVDPAWRDDLFELISRTPNLDWLLLTKRIGKARDMFGPIAPGADFATAFPNVWLGATVINQAEADRDIPKLLAVPARVRFLSIEPMLGAIDLSAIDVDGWHEVLPLGGRWLERDEKDCNHPRIHWVIAGGESGPHARPMHPDWVRSLRDQCAAAGVAFFVKQLSSGGAKPIKELADFPADLRFREFPCGL